MRFLVLFNNYVAFEIDCSKRVKILDYFVSRNLWTLHLFLKILCDMWLSRKTHKNFHLFCWDFLDHPLRKFSLQKLWCFNNFFQKILLNPKTVLCWWWNGWYCDKWDLMKGLLMNMLLGRRDRGEFSNKNCLNVLN